MTSRKRDLPQTTTVRFEQDVSVSCNTDVLIIGGVTADNLYLRMSDLQGRGVDYAIPIWE